MSKDTKVAKEVAQLTSMFNPLCSPFCGSACCVEALTTLAYQVPTRTSWWRWACSTPCALPPSKETPTRHDPSKSLLFTIHADAYVPCLLY
jgi:hypothetical protein